MVDFSHIRAKGQTRRDTVTYVFYGLEGQPELDVHLADSSNPRYFNAYVASRRNAMQATVLSNEEIKRQRRVDARLYAKHIVAAMRNVTDASGATVVFTEENVLEFFRAVIIGAYWEFDTFRGFVQNPQNFYAAEDLDDDDGDTIAEEATNVEGN